MIYTVKIDDNFPAGKKLIAEMRQYPEAVEFEIPAVVNDIAPERYIISEEFEKRAMAKVNKFCDEHRIL